MSGPYVVGAVGAGAASLLWFVFLFWNPYRQPDSQGAVIPTLMGVLSLLALGAAVLEAPTGMLVLGLAALPVGLYVLLSPGVFALIGIADVVVVVAAAWALVARYRSSTAPDRE